MSDFDDFRKHLAESRAFFTAGQRDSVQARRQGLKRLRGELVRNAGRLCSALYLDLGKSEFEAKMTEIMPLLQCLDYLIAKLPKLARPKRAATSIMSFPASARLYPEPYGLVLILSTWNYPLLLALEPLAGAIAAGNRAVLSLSPQSPATARIVRELVESSFVDGEAMALEGEFSFEQLLGEPYDYIFFTGGDRAGREVLKRAAEHLTPVTLELGGKSPCVVDRTADLAAAARRIVWGKFLNAGQTCIAPDYLLVHRLVKSELLNAMRDCIAEFYGDNPISHPDYPRIVNETHYRRLSALLERGRLVAGGEKNPAQQQIAPTILDGITPDDPVMQQEVFGPILPVLEINSLDEAAAFINRRSKPLALYFFGRRRDARHFVMRTSAGGVTVNDTIMHFANPALPFGGVGPSGMGAYHGKRTFTTFSHLKPVLFRGLRPDFPIRYLPHTPLKRKLLNLFCK